MAAYVVALNNSESLARYLRFGLYGTIVRTRQRRAHVLMTLADYAGMADGELIFFLRDRRLYGIGRLRSLSSAGPALGNWEDAFRISSQSQEPYIWNREDAHADIPWVVTFEPYPEFFQEGVDMDEVLQLDALGVTRGLRLFSDRTFIKIEDDEANLIANLVLRQNRAEAESPSAAAQSQLQSFHDELSDRELTRHLLDVDTLVLENTRTRQGRQEVTFEGILQIWFAAKLAMRSPEVALLGDWDYFTNQEPASPMKPRQYMDHIDIFGYQLERLHQSFPPIVSNYKIVELKAGFQSTGDDNVVDQTMKYVDWVALNRAGGDFGRVAAFIVAPGFSQDLVDYARSVAEKPYMLPWRPYGMRTWTGMRLIEYRVNEEAPAIELTVVE